MHGYPISYNLSPSDRIGDIAFGNVSHRSIPTHVTIHYRGRPFAVVDFIARPKEGLLAKIKKALVRRKVALSDPY